MAYEEKTKSGHRVVTVVRNGRKVRVRDPKTYKVKKGLPKSRTPKK